MKVIKILKENKRVMKNFVNSFDNDCKDDDEYISANEYINQLDETIRELEELNSRSCYNCSYYEFNKGFGIAVCCNQDNSQEHCSYAKMQIEEDFCCKKWESK